MKNQTGEQAKKTKSVIAPRITLEEDQKEIFKEKIKECGLTMKEFFNEITKIVLKEEYCLLKIVRLNMFYGQYSQFLEAQNTQKGRKNA